MLGCGRIEEKCEENRRRVGQYGGSEGRYGERCEELLGRSAVKCVGVWGEVKKRYVEVCWGVG